MAYADRETNFSVGIVLGKSGEKSPIKAKKQTYLHKKSSKTGAKCFYNENIIFDSETETGKQVDFVHSEWTRDKALLLACQRVDNNHNERTKMSD